MKQLIRTGLQENLMHNLQLLRYLRGETGKDVEAATGIYARYVYSWEMGSHEPIATHLVILARYYGVSVEFLFKDWLLVLRQLNGLLDKEENEGI